MKIYDITKEARDQGDFSTARSTGLYWKQDPTGEYPEGMLRAGPPYPNEEKPMVRHMQQGLEELGYNIGRTGVDGKYGPRTTRAVDAFKTDYNVPGSPMNFGNAGFEKLKDVLSGKITQLKPEKQTKIDTTAKGGGELGPMDKVTMWNPKLDGPPSVTKGKIGGVLDVIAEPESRGRYDIVYPGRRRPHILNMTLNELYKDMRERGNQTGSSASGRYQYIRKTLKGVVKSMGLDEDKTKFTPAVQDKIAVYHLRLHHGLDSWLANNYSDEAFLKRLSRTWAGLPKDSSGNSYYKGDKIGNKAGVTFPHVMAALQNIRGTVT